LCVPDLLVLLLEPVDAALRVDQLLLPGKKRVAVGADFHADVALMSRAGFERVPAGANDVDFFVGGVNSSFHGNLHNNTKPRTTFLGPQRGSVIVFQTLFALRGPFHRSSGLDTDRNLNVSGSTLTVGHLTRGLSTVF